MDCFALVTPSYRGDLERCALLCESVDLCVSGFSKHYLIVDDDCLGLFAHLAGPRRVVIPVSEFLPRWLRSLPSFVRRKDRHYWWSFRVLPVDGWHVQQILKIAAVCTLPEERYCLLDSDIVFFRPFDLKTHARPEPLRLYCQPRAITESFAPHASWIAATHRLLGIGAASFPGSDFVTNVVLWDQCTARAMVDRIEAVNRSSWIEAVCRARYELSEYMLYGHFVLTTEAHAREHNLTESSLCISYFDKQPLKQAAALEMLSCGSADQVGFSAASYSGTSIDMIRQIRQVLQPKV